MAMSRLEDFIKPYIVDYLNSQGNIKNTPDEINIQLSKKSLGVSNVYTKNKALSLFANNNDYGKQFWQSFETMNCFNGDVRYVHRDDEDHDKYHRSSRDYEIDHTHILKGQRVHQEMSGDDVDCIIKHIKKHDLSISNCKDGQTNCIITDRDANRIVEGYKNYLSRGTRSKELDAAVNRIYSEFEARYIAGTKSFAQSFATTLLDRYMTPFLINQGVQRQTASWSMEIAKSTLTLALSSSLSHTAYDAIIRNVLQPIFNKLGINSHYIEKIFNTVGTVAAFTNNPLSLIELGVNGSAAAAGQVAAYTLIHALPKLKSEPIVSSDNKPTEAKRVNGTLHRRGKNI